MTQCCVIGCKSKSSKNEPGISFHRLPKNAKKRAKWLQNIGRRNWNPTSNTYICSLHFEKSCINYTLNVPRAKDDCFPTIFPHRKVPIKDEPDELNTTGTHGCLSEQQTTVSSSTNTIERDHSYVSSSTQQVSTVTMDKLTNKVKTQQKKIKRLNEKIRRQAKKMNNLQSIIATLKDRNCAGTDMVVDVGTTSEDEGTTPDDEIKPDDEETALDDEIKSDDEETALDGEIMLDDETKLDNEEIVLDDEIKSDEEETALDIEIISDDETVLDDDEVQVIADDAGMELGKVNSTEEDQSDDDMPLCFIVVADDPTEDESDSQLDAEEEVEKRKRGPARKCRAATDKSTEPNPKRTRIRKAVDNDIDFNKHVSVIKLSMEEQLEELNKRKQSSNYRNSPYKCNLCYRGFIHTQAWVHHLRKHDPSSGDIECPLCKIRFKKESRLNRHNKTIHNIKYVCKSCPHFTMSEPKARLHQKWHEGVTYKCKHCDEEYTKHSSYLNHVRLKHPSDFICDLCGDSFVSKKGLSMHKNRIHKDVTDEARGDDETEQGAYCKECDIKFVSVEAWNRHMVISDKHKQTVHFENLCRVCGKTFESSGELQRHRQREHAPKSLISYVNPTGDTNGTWPAKCQHCSEQFFSKREYWVHYRKKHPGENYPVQRNHVCDICGKRYPSNTHLQTHKWKHSEKKQFKCEQCGKEFYSPGKLRFHETWTHTDLRPFCCPVCGKAFKSKGARERHLKTHTGEKPYVCEICGATFTADWNRKLHVNSVHLKRKMPRKRRRVGTGTNSSATRHRTHR